MDERPEKMAVENAAEEKELATSEVAALVERPVVAGVNLASGNKDANGKAQAAISRVSQTTADAKAKVSDEASPANQSVANATTALSSALAAGDTPAQLKPLVQALLTAVRDHARPIRERSAGAGGGGAAGATDASGGTGAAGAANKATAAADKAESYLNKVLNDLGRIENDVSKGWTDATNIGNAGNAGQVANGIGSVLGDLGDAIDAVGDLIGGPLGAAISAIGDAISSFGSWISSTFGDNSQNSNTNTDPNNTNQTDPNQSDPNQTDPGETDPGGDGDGGDGGGGGCFSGQTAVLMADGSRRPIANLCVGDVVAARDELTGETAGQPVAQVFRHVVDETLTLRLKSGEDLATTAVHRFATEAGAFTGAGSLRQGDRLATHGVEGAEVEGTSVSRGRFEVYNLEVHGSHTFFVGSSAVWVHNLKIVDPEKETEGDDSGDKTGD